MPDPDSLCRSHQFLITGWFSKSRTWVVICTLALIKEDWEVHEKENDCTGWYIRLVKTSTWLWFESCVCFSIRTLYKKATCRSMSTGGLVLPDVSPCSCFALQASGLWLRYGTQQNLTSGNLTSRWSLPRPSAEAVLTRSKPRMLQLLNLEHDQCLLITCDQTVDIKG